MTINAADTLLSQIELLADEFARLDPVGCSVEGDAGYCSHDGDGDKWPAVGWYAADGNVGHCVVSVHPDDLAAAVAVLRTLPDGASNMTGLDSYLYDPAAALTAAGVRHTWHV